MKASELRIGNLIKGIYHDYDDGIDEEIENETICKVVTLDVSGSGDYPIYVYSDENIEHFSEFKPIPLTEEWLLKFGFQEHPNDYYYFEGYKIRFDLDNDLTPIKFYFLFFDIGDWEMEIKYVHQIQNLYFALKEEELKQIEQ